MPIRAAFLTAAGRASTMTRRRSSTRACARYSRLRTSVCPICWTRGDPQHDELNAGESASRESLFRQHVVVAQDARQLPLTVLLLPRSEEHTSELQSQSNLVCRLLLEKKKKKVTYS